GLRELACGCEIIADLDHRPFGVYHAKIDDGVHLDRHIVPGDHVLGRHFVDHDSKIDPHHLLHDGHQQEESGALRAGVAPEREDDAALVLAQDTHRRVNDADDEDCDNDDGYSRDHGLSPWMSRRLSGYSTTSTRPSRPMTLTRVPGCIGRPARAR